ncbi:glycosyltransferase family 39 protein [Baekduia soli]|uniref:glycosyltransferase family 39 protein n=1 Tax=Baekduia soli TaxID=496014 RepID=UPI001651C9C8|nr:glycosyltransferase family 39 protein [Baekduia soli]
MLAAILRLVDLGRTPIDPFYAGAVRSMGTSWHAFFVGAYDPSARLAIDKAPVDLWLQVASTNVLGFTPTAMLLPAALGGTVAVAALYDLLHTLAGRRVAIAGALALAVLPMAVLTSRSDTMDSVMAALVVAGFAVGARGMRAGRSSRLVAAGALMGVAFETKLFEALIPAVPLAVMWWWGAPGTRAQRARAIVASSLACAAVGLAWLVALSLLVPATQRPWAFGSTDGSAWSSTFVYDGWQRLTGSTPINAGSATDRVPAGAGPLRLFSAHVHLDARVGFGLGVAWISLVVALAAGAWRSLDRTGRAGAGALALWLGLGTVIFSAQRDLRPRYLEAVDPAIAAVAGLGLVLGASAVAARLHGRVPRGVLRGIAVAAVIMLVTVPAVVTAGVISSHAQDSGTPGALPTARLAALSSYLRSRQGGARYEAAFLPVAEAGGLIARDGRPVLMLDALGHPLVTPAALQRLIAGGQVHTAVVGTARTPMADWIRAHGSDVSAAAGQRVTGTVYALAP